MQVSWARHVDEVREAQRLRWQVFAGELGASIDTLLPGHDADRFDEFCEHLLVRAEPGGPVVGTYRLLTPQQAVRAGGGYCEQEFDLGPVAALRPRMGELGRSCVHPDHRRGAVILSLWGALSAFLHERGLESVLGCVCIGSGAAAAGVWNRLRATHLVAQDVRVTPLHPLDLTAFSGLQEDAPPLLRGYLRVGARVLGAPAWDAHFRVADLPVMLHTADLPRRYRSARA